jgi:hypothetical protein
MWGKYLLGERGKKVLVYGYLTIIRIDPCMIILDVKKHRGSSCLTFRSHTKCCESVHFAPVPDPTTLVTLIGSRKALMQGETHETCRKWWFFAQFCHERCLLFLKIVEY